MPHFTKPAEGSWTEHYPELGTGPVSYDDSISPEHYELEREAIFGRTWLNVGRVEQLPKTGSYFTKELDAAAHVGRRRARHGRRGPRLPQHLPPPRQQARVDTTTRARRRAAPAGSSRASTTAGATTSRASCTFVQQEAEFFDLDKADYRARVGAVRGVGGVHLREPRPRRTRRRCASTSASSARASRATRSTR